MIRTILVVLGVLLLLGFYKVTDQVHLHGDVLLTTADRIAYTVCHRLPTHSFMIFGRSLPLCARCSGIYLGIVWGFTYLASANRLYHARFPRRNHLLLLIALVAIMGVDGFNSLFHDMGRELYPPQNWLRLITGMGAGIAIALIVVPTFAQTAWQNLVWEPPVETQHDALILVIGAVVLILLLISGAAPIVYVLALVSAFGVVLILSCLYAILVLLITRRDNAATTPRMVIAPLIGGLLLATVQIVGVAYFRFNLTGTWLGF